MIYVSSESMIYDLRMVRSLLLDSTTEVVPWDTVDSARLLVNDMIERIENAASIFTHEAHESCPQVHLGAGVGKHDPDRARRRQPGADPC